MLVSETSILDLNRNLYHFLVEPEYFQRITIDSRNFSFTTPTEPSTNYDVQTVSLKLIYFNNLGFGFDTQEIQVDENGVILSLKLYLDLRMVSTFEEYMRIPFTQQNYYKFLLYFGYIPPSISKFFVDKYTLGFTMFFSVQEKIRKFYNFEEVPNFIPQSGIWFQRSSENFLITNFRNISPQLTYTGCVNRRSLGLGTRSSFICDERVLYKEFDEEEYKEFHREYMGMSVFIKDTRFDVVPQFGFFPDKKIIINRYVKEADGYYTFKYNSFYHKPQCLVEVFLDIIIELYILNCCCFYHGDVKLENIIYSANENRFKLIDLGVLSVLGDSIVSYSAWFCPPELLNAGADQEKSYRDLFDRSPGSFSLIDRSKTDVYALAMSIFIGRSPNVNRFFRGKLSDNIDNEEWGREMEAAILECADNLLFTDTQRDIFIRCLSINPNERPIFSEILTSFDIDVPDRNDILRHLFPINTLKTTEDVVLEFLEFESEYNLGELSSFINLFIHFYTEGEGEREAKILARYFVDIFKDVRKDTSNNTSNMDWVMYYFTDIHLLINTGITITREILIATHKI